MKTLAVCLITTLLLIGNAHGLTFEDGGVPYETLETKNFMVRYEPGDRQAAIDVSKTLEDSHEKITRDLGIKPKEKTIIELYTTPKLYQQYRKPAAWAIGGKVYPGRNMIALPSPSTWGKANIHRYEDLWHVLPHEYIHLLLRGATKNRLPIWLDEGVAIYESSQWNPGYQRILMEAIEKDKLPTLRELDDFNAFIKGGALSYAESYTAAHYLRTAYGENALRRIIDRLAQGMSFEEALKATTGKSMDEFEEGWLLHLKDMLKTEKQATDVLKNIRDARLEQDGKAAVAKVWDELSSGDESENAGATKYPVDETLPTPTHLGAGFAAIISLAVFLKILKELVKKKTQKQTSRKTHEQTRFSILLQLEKERPDFVRNNGINS